MILEVFPNFMKLSSCHIFFVVAVAYLSNPFAEAQ